MDNHTWLWWSCLRIFKEYFVSLLWCSLNNARTRVQQIHESSVLNGLLENSANISLLWTSRKIKSTVATSGKVLLGGRFVYKLSHMFVWITNEHLLWFATTSIRGVFIEQLVITWHCETILIHFLQQFIVVLRIFLNSQQPNCVKYI